MYNFNFLKYFVCSYIYCSPNLLSLRTEFKSMGNLPIGAGGGTGAEITCPPGHVFTQFDVRSGQFVDAISATCSDGTTTTGWKGNTTSTGGVKRLSSTDGITGYGGRGTAWVDRIDFKVGDTWSQFGGNGGQEVGRTICEPQQALNKMKYQTDGKYVTQLQFWCGPFTQKEAIARAREAAATAALAAKIAADAAAKAAEDARKASADAAAKVAEEERTRAAAEAARVAAERAAADAKAANERAAAERAVADAKAAAERATAERAAAEKASADASALASASAKSSESATASSNEASKQASAAASAPTAGSAGVAARAAEQSAQNATSAAAEATRPVVTDTKKPTAVVALGGKVDEVPVTPAQSASGDSYTWLIVLFFLIIIIAVGVYVAFSGKYKTGTT
jgi:flagellar biosynthesis GTPase FlhF